MQYQHLTYFKVENFKKFKSLEINDIGQFNLIVGDNNVGKTCLLEALLIGENPKEQINSLHYTLCKRNVHIHPININSSKPIFFPTESYFDRLKNDVQSKRISFHWKTNNEELNSVGFEDWTIDELTDADFSKEKPNNYNFARVQRFWIKIFLNSSFEELQLMYLDDVRRSMKYDRYLPFISMGKGYSHELNSYFSQNIERDGEKQLELDLSDPNEIIQSQVQKLSYENKLEFLKNLNLFFNDVEDITINEYGQRLILSLKLKEYKDWVPVTYFGDGTNIFIRYVLEIMKNRGGRLMIDEFGEGIHFTRLKDFCSIIFKVAIRENVQIYATTHSKECIEAYIEASEELGINEKTRLIELKEYNKEIYSNTLNYKEVNTALGSGINLRGGKLFA